MHGVQHKRMGVALGAGILVYSLLSNSEPALSLCMLTTPMGVMLPDIDHDRTKIGRVRSQVTTLIKVGIVASIGGFIFLSYKSGGLKNLILNLIFLGVMAVIINIIERNKFIKKQLGFITKHRGIMHTLVPPAFIMGTTWWTSNIYYFYGVLGFVLGYVVHLLGDMATEEGAPVLWPLFKSNIRYLKLNTTNNSTILEVVCNLWCLIFIGVSIYLGRGII
jgi:membrane-bound metal-dependent hydrolase YbcI (DUF457 family)